MIQANISCKNLRATTAEKIIREALYKAGWGTNSINVFRVEPPISRADRFSKALELVSEAQSMLEELRDEVQNWHDNLPENLQDSDKGSMLDDAGSTLEEMIGNLEDVSGNSVEFPGMYS